jgi:hypothetical protein
MRTFGVLRSNPHSFPSTPATHRRSPPWRTGCWWTRTFQCGVLRRRGSASSCSTVTRSSATPAACSSPTCRRCGPAAYDGSATSMLPWMDGRCFMVCCCALRALPEKLRYVRCRQKQRYSGNVFRRLVPAAARFVLPIAPRDRRVSGAVLLLGRVQVLPLLTACDVAGAGV